MQSHSPSAHPESPSPPLPEPHGAEAVTARSGGDSRPGLRLVAADARERHLESRRVHIGLGVLVALCFVTLNVVIYEGARTRTVAERWDQLAASTEEKRRTLRRMLLELRHEAVFVASEDEVRRVFAETRLEPAAPAGAPASPTELEHVAASFDLLGIQLVERDGTPIGSTRGTAAWNTERTLQLGRAVAQSGRTTFLPGSIEYGDRTAAAVAAPVLESTTGEVIGAAILIAGIEDRTHHSMLGGVASGLATTGYLAIREGAIAHIATTPPPGSGLTLGERVRLDDPSQAAAAMAAQQVETKLEIRRPGTPLMWAATVAIPELNGGLVGEADRGEMLAGLQVTLLGLALLDLGVVALAIALMWLWRRQNRREAQMREAALQRAHAERIQAVVDNAFDAILSLDVDGRVLTSNRAAERLFLRPAAELAGRPVDDLLRRARDGARDAQRQGPWEMWRSQALRPDGTEVAVEYSLASSGHGDTTFYTLVARDVSARVEAERQIQAFATGLEVSNRRLEEANNQLAQASRLKSEFLANTSHELRTPLNGIMGFLQLVLDGLCDTPEEERDFLGQALQCSKHLLGLINDVLDIAKIEAGRLTLQIEPVDVSAVFAEVFTVTHVQAEQKGLMLKFEHPEALGPQVRGDFGKVKQILINLVGNSLKFTEQGTIIVRMTPYLTAGHCMFEVIDTGIGIPPDRQTSIFEKFIQADGSTTRRYGGTGLGLAITRSLVELMGGIITVESSGVGHGTRMVFSLPVWRGEEHLATPSDSGETLLPNVISGPAGGPLVLVVDDDPVFRQFVTSMLQHHGYRTAEAAHAEAGWVLVRRLRPALVLLDYALSCADGAALRTGWDLAERMQHDARSRHIPFMFVTGFDAQLLAKLQSAMTFARQPRYMAKPVSSRALLTQIEASLGDLPNRMVRVLLADDDPMVAAFITKALPPERFQVEVVNDGEECLHCLRTQPKAFDLLLLDLMMPEISGYDVLRDMALTGVGARLPVIVLTNEPQARNPMEQRLLEQGCVLEVVSKSAVHESVELLPRMIDVHLSSVEFADANEGPPLEVERFHAELPEGDAAASPAPLGVERFTSQRQHRRPEARPAAPAAVSKARDGDDTHDGRAAA